MQLSRGNSFACAKLRRANLVKLTSLDLLENKKKASITKRFNKVSISSGGSLQMYKALTSPTSYVIVVRLVGAASGDFLGEFMRDKPFLTKKIYSVTSMKSLYSLLTNQPHADWLIESLSGGSLYLIEFGTSLDYLAGVRAFIAGEELSAPGAGKIFEIIFVREGQNYIDFRVSGNLKSSSELRKLYLQSNTTILLELGARLTGVVGGIGLLLSSSVLAGSSCVSGNLSN